MAKRKPRTFKVQSPTMTGSDVRSFQGTLNGILRSLGVNLKLKADGKYGVGTRAVTATVCHALGFDAKRVMRDGVTPHLRTKIRHRQRTPREEQQFKSRAEWRDRLRRRYEDRAVAPMVAKVVADSWGWVPGRHDGLDVITLPDAPIFAMCDAKVIRVSDDWWGLGSPGGALADKGDGIIVLECLTDAGPFFKGMRVCYGHAEKPTVKVGQRVEAGRMIGHSGLANAWHIHLMVHGRKDDRGKGDRDPRPFYDYARRSG